jgi:predicted amidohydrolase YtcJ
LTGVHDFDGADCFAAVQSLRNRGRLGLRVLKNIMVDDLPAALDVGLQTGFGDNWIRIGNIKIFADGALGSHTAAMLRPYEGEPDNQGILLKDDEEILSLATAAADGGLAMTIHAIGDRANHVVLDAFERLRAYEAQRGLPHGRHRIEHLQLLHPEDMRRPGALDLVASMQPIHALSDREMADQFWGDRVRYAYAWKSQLESGTRLAFGSDAPVDSPDPFLGLYAAVTRRPFLGDHPQEAWYPEECISLWDALRAYTLGPAYIGHQETQAGTLAPGKLADLIVLEEDLFSQPAERLLEMRVLGTMVGGEWRFRT